MSHKHHIMTKHAGGTDDLSNLVELSVDDHAEAHRVLYEQYVQKNEELILQIWKLFDEGSNHRKLLINSELLGIESIWH